MNNMTRPFFYLLLACSLASVPAKSSADSEDLKRYDFLIKGMDDQRQRLRTGMYRINGRYISESTETGRLDGPVKIFSAFDFDADKFRFDRTGPIREGKVPPAPLGADARSSWTLKMRGGRMIRLKDRNISNGDDSMQVRIGSMNPMVQNDLRPLDVRAFGLFYWQSMSSFPATPYPKFLEYYERDQADEVVEERRGIWKITKTFPTYLGHTSRRILWIDQKAGFSPIRLELRQRDDSMPAGTWSAPDFESETTWIEIAGVWVPKTARIVDDPGTAKVASYEFPFDWEMVNGVVPPETFTLAGLKLKPGYQVVDDTLGRDVIVGSIGADHALVERASSPPPPAAPNRAWRGWSSFLPHILAGLGICVIGLAAWFRFHPARRGSPTV